MLSLTRQQVRCGLGLVTALTARPAAPPGPGRRGCGEPQQSSSATVPREVMRAFQRVAPRHVLDHAPGYL